MDMLVTMAEPPANEAVRKNIESIVPFSGVKISLSLAPKETPNVLKYGIAIWALAGLSDSVLDTGGQALRGQMYFDDDYLWRDNDGALGFLALHKSAHRSIS